MFFIINRWLLILLGWLLVVSYSSPVSGFWDHVQSPNTTSQEVIDIGTWDEYDGAQPYQVNQRYYKGDKVLYDGHLWIVLKKILINSVPGKVIGDYNEITNRWTSYNTYKRGDLVYHGGDLWIAKRDSQNKEPTFTSYYWEIYNEAD